jgi:DNA-binding transcriptional regulator LsrR (DeoR family)
MMVKVARLYYEHGYRQSDIAQQLNISQASISRLLKRAQDEEIVRIKVSVPHGTYPELEEAVQSAYGLHNVIVVDTGDNEQAIMRDIGAAAAFYLETTIQQHDVIGISSWSSTLLAMLDAMQPLPQKIRVPVIQILGGIGDPTAQVHAAQLTRRLALLVNGEAVFLPAPGIVGSAETQRAFLDDQYVRAVIQRFSSITIALVGIGAVEPSPLLATSGNVFSPDEQAALRRLGAVGDICLRFFDDAGHPVTTPLHDRVLGITLEQLRQVRRCIGIAGGQRKLAAIAGALRGGLVNVLITDRWTAEHLI